jgi:hypothetical protein
MAVLAIDLAFNSMGVMWELDGLGKGLVRDAAASNLAVFNDTDEGSRFQYKEFPFVSGRRTTTCAKEAQNECEASDTWVEEVSEAHRRSAANYV